MTRYVKHLEQLGIPSNLAILLEQFAQLFLRWNERINLSAARDLEALDEHILDSLQIVPHITPASHVLDVGAGGGFPSVITAICVPDANVIALEPTHKKHAFLRTASRELGLSNLDARAERVEDHQHFSYDVAMSRATFDLREWLHRGQARVRDRGIVIGFEGVRRDDLPLTIQRHPYDLLGKHRAIITLQKPGR